MKPLDDELRSLLKRREPSAGFAERVLARLGNATSQRDSTRRSAPLWRRPVMRWAVVAAMCMLAVLGIVRDRQQQRRRAQAEQASRQAVWALTVASTELNAAMEQARRITVQALAAHRKNAKTRME
jgi:hypothetical protein